MAGHAGPIALGNEVKKLVDHGDHVERIRTESVTVQCADCFAWIKKDANHTCRQQIKRNQKGQNEG